MFERFAAVILVVGLLLLFTPVHAEQQAPPKLMLNGYAIEFEVQPVTVEGIALVPLRHLLEELGATVEWNQEMKAFKATRGDRVLQYKIGDTAAYRDEQLIVLPVPGQVVGGHTLMPVRFVAESLGAEVGWESYTRTILISSRSKRAGVVSKAADGAAVEVLPIGEQHPAAETVRLIGVNIPAPGGEGGEQSLQLGKAAAGSILEQLEGKTVGIEIDMTKRDPEDRVPAYLYLDDGTMVNAMLIAEGYALAEAVPPDLRWTELFQSLQSDARMNGRGIWKQEAASPVSPM